MNSNIVNSDAKNNIKEIDESKTDQISGGSGSLRTCKVCGRSFDVQKVSHSLCLNCFYQQYTRESYCKKCGEKKVLDDDGYCFDCSRHLGYSSPAKRH